MVINKLTASFGALDNETLSFHNGLNIADVNDGTEKLWCDFVGAMLYGVDDGLNPEQASDALRFAPVSGAPMEGCMELTAEGCDITLSRTTSAKDAPMREFSAVYTGTSRPVESVCENNAGEMLTGVQMQVFNRCAVLGKSPVDLSVGERIVSLSRSGEEGVSYTEADETLRRWQRDRRYMRRGLLPELELKMSQTQRELSDIEKNVRDAEKLEQSLEAGRSRCAELEAAVNEARRNQRRDALDKLTAGRTALKERSQAHDDSLCALNASKESLRKSRFGTKSLEKLEAEVNTDLAGLEALKLSGGKKPSAIPAVLCFLLAVVGAALYTAYHQAAYVIGAVVFCLAAIVLIMRFSKRKNAVSEAASKRREILELYSAQSADDIRTALEEHRALWEKVRQSEHDEQCARSDYEKALKAQQVLESAALGELDFSSGSSETASLGRELSEARAECESISSKLSVLRGRIAAAGDPLVLGSTLSAWNREHELISNEYDAIELAVSTLRDADTVMQNDITPELGRLAYRYMTVACDGVQPLLTDGSQLNVPANVNEVLAYLSIRLAICEAEMPAGESLPLMMVDVFSGMDESTASQAMVLLREIARKRQVIILR